MKTTRILTLVSLLFITLSTSAQSKMTVILRNGIETTFPVSEIEKIIWSDDNPKVDDPTGDDPIGDDPIASGATGLPAAVKAVDLGLSVKWANMNVGATEVAGSKINPHTGRLDCYGEYYAWGEVLPKETYNMDTYKFKTTSGMSKYTYKDKKNTLELEDDAASYNWGGSWRMPTIFEMQELKKNCTFTYTTNYNGTGVIGFVVTGPNGNSIFMPAGGRIPAKGNTRVGEESLIWLSTLYGDSQGYEMYIEAPDYESQSGEMGDDYCSRDYGLAIRPVCP